MLYVDIPAPSDISALATFRGEGCVSIYLRTTPVTPLAQGDPIELKNLARRVAVDEIATRVITSGGRVIGVRKAEIPRPRRLRRCCAILSNSRRFIRAQPGDVTIYH